jgi:transcriptional regulator with XRE-family HTH domain
VSNSELGAFLRGRREAVTPAEAGLPTGARRRTPGLRRAELATLAGVSVDYLTRLEQGRDRNPSAEILGALADALRLSRSERIHLRMLAKTGDGASCRGLAVDPPNRTVRPTVQALLDRLEPAPAYVADRLGDVLACTTGYQQLAGPLGLLDGDRPNLVRFVFTDPRARTAYPDWERVADERVAALPVVARHSDPYLAELVDELTVTAGCGRPAFRGSPGWSAWPIPPWGSCGSRTRCSTCPMRTISAWWSCCPPTTPRRPRWTASPGAGRAGCARCRTGPRAPGRPERCLGYAVGGGPATASRASATVV